MSETGLSITIKSSGIAEYQKRLAKVGRKLEELDKPLKEAGEIAKALVRSYPPYGDWRRGQVSFISRYPGAKYVRTRTLQRAWKGQLRRGSRVLFSYRVFNYSTVENRKRRKYYLRYVQGEEQTPPHIGRWHDNDDMRDMMSEEAGKIFKRYMRDVAKA